MQGFKQMIARVPYDLWVDLKKAALTRGISLNQLVIDALENKRKKIKKDI